jgi:DNA modification methylase
MSDNLIPEEQMFYLDPTEIKVHGDLPRVRNHMQKINELGNSIKQYGQFNPIIITRNKELIMGGRRLAACLMFGMKVKCAYRDDVDPTLLRELELEENLQRDNLTPTEEAFAISEIHRLKQQRFGEAKPGPNNTGWGLDDTAHLLGKKSSGTVIEALKIAEMASQFPALKEAKTKSEVKKNIKGIEKVQTRMGAVATYEEIIKKMDTRPVFIEKADAREWMKQLPDKSIDLLFTDPIYGIDIDEVAIHTGGVTGGLSATGFKYTDDRDEALSLYKDLAKESYRFCKDDAHGWVFLGPENFWDIRSIFLEAGWLVHFKPFIWIKGPTGQNNAPHAWPSSAYEMCMYVRKLDSRLVVEGKIDWAQFSRVPPSEKKHDAQKPLLLAKELISRTSLPGHHMADPFMGSGALVIAALEMSMVPHGCDILDESYATALEWVAEWKKAKEN